MSNVVPSSEQSQRSLIPTLYIAVGVIVIIALVALLGWGVIWAARTYPTEIAALRDVFIIGLALTACLFTITLVLLLIMVVRLVNMLEFEIKPILEQTNETVRTVRGTTAFVSQKVVQPVAKAGGYLAGLQKGFKVLIGNPRRNLPD
jgi:uncharacterized membrane protein